MRGRVEHERAHRTEGKLMKKSPHSEVQPDSAKAITYALMANVAIACAEFAGAMFTDSGSMLARGFHWLADSGNQSLILWGLRSRSKAEIPPSALGVLRAVSGWAGMASPAAMKHE